MGMVSEADLWLRQLLYTDLRPSCDIEGPRKDEMQWKDEIS